MSIKITGLTPLNIEAVRECYQDKPDPVITATTIKFWGHQAYVLQRLDEAFEKAAVQGTQGHPYQSLHAVRRKVEKASEG
jgi:hypothetical protein